MPDDATGSELSSLFINYSDECYAYQLNEDDNSISTVIENGISPKIAKTVENTIDLTSHILDDLRLYNIIVIDTSLYSKNSSIYESVLSNLFNSLRLAHLYFQTTSPDSIHNIANRFLHSTKKSICLFISGDTTIFEFLNFLAPKINSKSQQELILLPFPNGTGNALANSLNIFNDLHSIAALFKFKPKPLPLYCIQSNQILKSLNPALEDFSKNNGIFFLVVASWGLHSTLVFESDKPEMRNNFGSSRFRIAAEKILEINPTFKANVKLNSDKNDLIYKNGKWVQSLDQQYNFQNFSYFLLTSVPFLEKTFNISPNSSPFDNDLHLIAIPHIPAADIMSLMNKAYDSGNHVSDQRVFYDCLNKNPIDLYISDEMDESLSVICLDGSSWKVLGTNRKLTFFNFNQDFLFCLS